MFLVKYLLIHHHVPAFEEAVTIFKSIGAETSPTVIECGVIFLNFCPTPLEFTTGLLSWLCIWKIFYVIPKTGKFKLLSKVECPTLKLESWLDFFEERKFP